MSVSGSDLDVLSSPARRGFAQALREIRQLLGGARAVELYGAAGSQGAALAFEPRWSWASLAPGSPAWVLGRKKDPWGTRARPRDLQ